ncbi:hypothetical protein TNIN_18841, partial [Trichonephila inaurata madagascariensis]
GPERKRGKGPHRQGDKRRLPSSANSSTHSRKRFRQAEALIEELDIGRYNLRLRVKRKLSPDHPEDRCRTNGDQSRPKEEDSKNLDPTIRIKDTSSGLHARVARSRNKS